MLIVPTPKFRRRREPAQPRVAMPAPPAPVVLVSANFFPDDVIVVMTLDRAVNVSGFDGSVISVNDPASGQMYLATGGVEQLSDIELQLFMNATGSSTGAQTIMNAGSGNGIIAASGGGVWPGVVNLVLPFGE